MKSASAKTYYIGTSGWIYPAWRGPFYPPDLPTKDWFAYYQLYFPIVEINATFYRSFDKKVFLKWKNQAKRNFKYVVKVNRYITHIKKLVNCRKYIKRFCRRVDALGNKLALILLQLPPRIAYDPERLCKALHAFPDPKKVVVEFRNNKWYTNEVKQILTELGCIFCTADSPQSELMNWVTSRTAYIRMHGHKRWYNYRYTETELKALAKFARKLHKKGAKKIYILFNNDYYSYASQNALRLKKLLKV